MGILLVPTSWFIMLGVPPGTLRLAATTGGVPDMNWLGTGTVLPI